VDRAIGQGSVGQYPLQAAIAALHDRADRAADTDWPQILALYGLLERMTGSPVVSLDRAVAAAMAGCPDAGLAVLEGIDGPLRGHHLYHAVRAHLLERASDPDGAMAHYRSAAHLATNLTEQRALIREAARLHARIASRPASPNGTPTPA